MYSIPIAAAPGVMELPDDLAFRGDFYGPSRVRFGDQSVSRWEGAALQPEELHE